MFKEIKNDVIKTLKYKNYIIRITIEERDNSINAYIQNQDYGIISHIYGLEYNKKKSIKKNIEEIEKCLETTIERDIYTYESDHGDIIW